MAPFLMGRLKKSKETVLWEGVDLLSECKLLFVLLNNERKRDMLEHKISKIEEFEKRLSTIYD